MPDRTIPTLEEIAENGAHRFPLLAVDAELAAVLIVHNRRLDALEQQARPYQEDGHLAVERSGDGEHEGIDDETFFEDARYLDVRRSWDHASKAAVGFKDERDAARATVERLSAALREVARHHQGAGSIPGRIIRDALKETPDA